MKTAIYLFTILLTINACKGKKEVVAQETTKKEEVVKEMSDADREAAIIDQMKNESPTDESGDYYKMVEEEMPESAIARIQRTPCFGRCPIYTLTVFEDGRVEYFGKKFAAREGRFEGEAPPESIKNLMKFADEIGYFDMDDVYDEEGITDLPSTITSLRGENGLKIVVHRFEGPEELRRFEKYFDSLFEEVNWNVIGE